MNNLSNQTKFIWILLAINSVLIGFYFSGIHILQQIIAPTISGLIFSQWREFGLMEMLQNVFLLCVIVLFVKQVFFSDGLIDKAFFALGTIVITFLFLEEIDYGLHYYEYFTGNSSGVTTRNWHNQWGSIEEGLENVTALKRANDAVNGLWFILIPLIALIRPISNWLNSNSFISAGFIPSKWFALGFIIALVLSKIAHGFDDAGFAIINEQNGNLENTIAEFRETSIYYLYFLYAVKLSDLKSVFKSK